MTISDEDLAEIRSALSVEGYSAPYMARIADHGREGIVAADAQAERDNREALRRALESTQAWARYRIY